jgi:hypothetical protein
VKTTHSRCGHCRVCTDSLRVFVFYGSVVLFCFVLFVFFCLKTKRTICTQDCALQRKSENLQLCVTPCSWCEPSWSGYLFLVCSDPPLPTVLEIEVHSLCLKGYLKKFTLTLLFFSNKLQESSCYFRFPNCTTFHLDRSPPLFFFI